MLELELTELSHKVRCGELSAVDVAEQTLCELEAQKTLGAFLTTTAPESLLRAAHQLDARRAEGEKLGPLAGVPMSIKDALCTRDAPTTCGSRILTRRNGENGPPQPEHGWRPPYDATVVSRLRQADALIVGKANMDEFAMGSSTENSGFFPARNPWAPDRIPGGSSGGSAVSVAAGMALGSLGSDTGGSIRQPAALCGVVGVKPTYGRVSRYGLVAFASSLDQVGPLARNVRGAARILRVIAGGDPLDSTCGDLPVPDYEAACERGVQGLRLGVPEEYFGEGLDPRCKESILRAVAALEREGCETRPVRMPHTAYGVATYYIVATAEASSNLARFDGVRFGLRLEESDAGLQAMYGATRNAGFGTEVKRRILLGTYVLSAGYRDAYYRHAQKVRTLIKQDFDRAFAEVDALVAPVTPTPAFRLGERIEDPLAMYLEDVYTLPSSLAGICALSVPAAPVPATADEPELPVGLQLLGPAFQEERLFALASAWEAVSPARNRRPPAPIRQTT